MSLTLSIPDLADPAASAAFYDVGRAAAAVDGYEPFNEQSLLDLASGRRSPRLLLTADDSDARREPVGAAIIGAGELDLVIRPTHRGRGYGDAALTQLLAALPGSGALTAWSHGDSPAARAMAARHGFEPARTLLQLRLDPLPELAHALPVAAGHFTVDRFDVGRDDDEWTALNARIFAGHPEQGRLTVSDLQARQAEPWFDPNDFLVARDSAGRMLGYNWLKVGSGLSAGVGEIYVIGVSPDAAGRGLGRALMLEGLERLRQRGCTAASLYVEADNATAVRLYRSLGFQDSTIDVQYRKITG